MEENIHVFHSGPIPQATCINCTPAFVQEVYFHTCWYFIIESTASKKTLKLFPVVSFKT